MGKIDRLVYGACELIQLGSIVGLAVIGLKRNQDCYKAECKAVELECALMTKELEAFHKDLEIEKLKREVNKLKNKHESEEGGA